MTAALLFDDLDLLAVDSPFGLEGLSTDNGTSWGNADTVDVELRSFIQVGQLVETENWTNRPLVLAIRNKGATNDQVAANEAILAAKLHRRSTVTYTPEDASVPTVFPVFTSTLVPTDSDFLETFDKEVVYQVRLTCAPFVRAAELEVVLALPITGTDALIEDITTGSTGWSAAYGPPYSTAGTMTVDASGATASLAGNVNPAGLSVSYVYDQKSYTSINTSVLKYLYFDWKFSDPANLQGVVAPDTSNAGWLPAGSTWLGAIPSPDHPGYTRTYYQIPTSAASIPSGAKQFVATFYNTGPVRPMPTFSVKRLGVTGTPPSLTARQLQRSLELKGVLPTEGSIKVDGAATGLGDVHVYSCPVEGAIGFTPACRQYLYASGATSTDSATVSGSKSNLTSANSEFHYPADKLPDGDYAVMARVDLSGKADADQQLAFAVGAYMGGVAVQPDEVLGFYDVSDQYDDALGGFQDVVLDILSLPRVKMAKTPNAYTKLVLRASVGAGTGYIDDLYLYNITLGQLHRIRAGAYPKLWIDSPDISNDGLPQLWLGTADDRSDQVSGFPFADALDIHQFDPIAGVQIFTRVTGPTTPVGVAFIYYPQFWYRAAAV